MVLGLLAVPAAAPAVAAVTAGPAFTDADGIHVVSARQLDAREYDVTIVPAALGRPVDVRVLVPADYGQRPTAHFPSLYLYHGTSGRASDWVTMGDAEATTAGRDLIVVMPDAGFNGDGGGWFTNWVDTQTALGPSQWETFDIAELVPWVDHNLRTVATRAGRAIAGLSQGGFGSTTYAARHPDMFLSAGSFSGAPDIDYNPAVAAGATVIIEGTAFGLDGVEPQAMFGSRATDEINWQGHDPAQLATNLRAVSLWLYTATGAPGPLDPPTPNPAASAIEAATHGSTISFVQRLQAVGVAYHLDDYVYGTHTWPYWARDLRWYIDPLMQLFAHPPPAPSPVSYASIDSSWSQWGWSVQLSRVAAQEFSWLDGAGPAGFSLAGTGRAAVTTPAFYPPGAAESVTMSGASGAGGSGVYLADAGGRLRLTVPLGTGSPPAVVGVPAAPGPGETTTVTIRPVRGR
ncbi:MAG: alpha/beta hydrolase [Actinomycetes bacterium]